MITTTDYTNKKIDIMASENYEGDLVFKFPNKIITGILKLAQIFTIRLFTQKGTKITDPNNGNNIFLKNSNKNNIEMMLRVAIENTALSLQNDNNDNLPDDEKLELATIDYMSFEADKIMLGYTLTTESKQEIKVVLPIDRSLF